MKSNYQISIIDKLRTLRQEHQFSQAQVASILGISTGQMGNIETLKASHKYTLEQIYTLCKKFKISVVDIFLNDEEKKLPADEKINVLIKNIVNYER